MLIDKPINLQFHQPKNYERQFLYTIGKFYKQLDG